MASFTRLVLPPPVLAELVERCRAELPLEACGFLAGRDGVVTQVLPVANELASPTAFRTEPRSTLAAFRAMRAACTDLLAVYHSHPTSEPVPSRRDLAENTYGETLWVIVGFADGEPAVRAWRLGASGAEELPVTG
jgi:proteasome lid subunit RPN8/RPN11